MDLQVQFPRTGRSYRNLIQIVHAGRKEVFSKFFDVFIETLPYAVEFLCSIY